MTSKAEGSRGVQGSVVCGERECGLWMGQVLELLTAKARPLEHAPSVPLSFEEGGSIRSLPESQTA